MMTKEEIIVERTLSTIRDFFAKAIDSDEKEVATLLEGIRKTESETPFPWPELTLAEIRDAYRKLREDDVAVDDDWLRLASLVIGRVRENADEMETAIKKGETSNAVKRLEKVFSSRDSVSEETLFRARMNAVKGIHAARRIAVWSGDVMYCIEEMRIGMNSYGFSKFRTTVSVMTAGIKKFRIMTVREGSERFGESPDNACLMAMLILLFPNEFEALARKAVLGEDLRKLIDENRKPIPGLEMPDGDFDSLFRILLEME